MKSIANLEPVHDAQVLTYLNLSNRPVGLLERSLRASPCPRVSVLNRYLRKLRHSTPKASSTLPPDAPAEIAYPDAT